MEKKMHLNINDVKKFKNTFLAFEINKVIDDATYIKLAKNYPNKILFNKSANNYPNRSFFNNSGNCEDVYKYFVQNTIPEWKILINHLLSKEFAKKIFSITRIYEKVKFLGIFGLLLMRPLKRVDSLADLHPIGKLFYQYYHVCIEFSNILKDGYISPHTDSARKSFSMMIYFTDENWEDRYGGGTCFFIPKNEINLRGSPENRNVTFDDFTLWHETTFEPNKLVGFMKNPYSWHGIKKIQCPANISRKALLITISIPKYTNIFKRINDLLMHRIFKFVYKNKFTNNASII